MKPARQSIFLFTVIAALAAVYAGQRYRHQPPAEPGHPLAEIARKINAGSARGWCDEHQSTRRLYAAQVVDRYRNEIANLWRTREQAPESPVPTVSLGKIRLRVSEPEKKDTKLPEYDDSSWSWEEVYGLIQKTQQDFLDTPKLRSAWRDIDSMTAYLLEKDYSRAVLGRKYLRPEITEHRFRPNGAVRRSGRKEFTVALDAGEFTGHEEALAEIITREWQGNGYRVKIQWGREQPGAYRFEANLRSGRTYVNHQRRAIVLENLAFTKTVAHEFGHVLGFDDHYYSVWNEQNCYYVQLARNGDLMSNSQRGHVQGRHWEILSQAYPWKAAPAKSFIYVFQPEKK